MGKDGQFNINFTDNKNIADENSLVNEQMEIAKKFHILNSSELVKKEGNWYFHDMTVEDYEDLMSGKDSDDIYKR